MEDWRRQTTTDLNDARARLETLTQSISGEPTGEELKSIWRAYLDVEKSVVFIKVELDEESPGVFVSMKTYKVPDERQGLRFALEALRRGTDLLSSGDLRSALRSLRESRNYLRVLLREKRLLKVKKARERKAG